MAPNAIQSLDQVEALVGSEIGVSSWQELDQPLVNQFADITGDHQWIHVDTERAAASDFGGTIVHGLFTLSLGSQWEEELIEWSGFDFALNYGYDKVRFPAALPVGRRLRMRPVGGERPALRLGRARDDAPDVRGRGSSEAGMRGRCARLATGRRRRRRRRVASAQALQPNGTSSGRSSPARTLCIAMAEWTIRAAVAG